MFVDLVKASPRQPESVCGFYLKAVDIFIKPVADLLGVSQ
jgi:hypothetical protein